MNDTSQRFIAHALTDTAFVGVIYRWESIYGLATVALQSLDGCQGIIAWGPGQRMVVRS